jgi:hypothetical protein
VNKAVVFPLLKFIKPHNTKIKVELKQQQQQQQQGAVPISVFELKKTN